MHNNDTGTWLARDDNGDGRVPEDLAAGYPDAQVSPDGSQSVAEAADPDWDWELRVDAAEAEAEQRFADFWGGTGPDYEAMADRDDQRHWHPDDPMPETPLWTAEQWWARERDRGEEPELEAW
jgi:hypothetical protein